MLTRRAAIQAALTAPLLGVPALAHASGPLVFLGDRDLPPYEFLDGNEPRGANIDLARAVGRVLGRPVEVRLMDWAEAQARLRSGEAHALTFLGRTEEREPQYDFTQATFPVAFALFVRADEAAAFQPGGRLEGRRVGVTRGGLPRLHIEANHPEATVVLVDDLVQGTRKLLRGEIDALGANAWAQRHLLYDLNIGGVTEVPAFSRRTGNMAVREGEAALLAELDRAITEVKASGEFDAIIDRWSGTRVHLVPRWVLRAAAAGGIAAVLGLAGLGLLSFRLRAGKQALAREIAERTRAERDLRLSESRYRGTFEQAAVGVAHVALDGGWVRVNGRLCAMLGYSEAELLARTFQEITHPEDLEADLGNVRRLLAGETDTYTMRKRYIRKGGSILWGELTVSLLRGEASGVPAHFIAIIQDITERVTAEATLAEREALLSAIGQSTPDLVFAKDPEGRVIYANPPTLALLGRPAEEVLGRTERDWMADEEQGRAIAENDRRVMARGEAETFEERVDDASHGGAKRVLLSTKAPLRDAAGRLVGIVGVARDVTEERAAQAALAAAKDRLEVVLEGAGLGSLHWDVPSGRVTFDERWAAMLGYRLDEVEPHRRSWERLVHPDDTAAVTQVLTAHLEGRTPVYECEHRLRHKDGSWIWVLGRGRVVERDAEGRALVATGTQLDITSRKTAEAALAASEERLALASSAARMGVWDWDAGSGTAVVTAEYRTLYGLPPSDEPIPVEDWLARVHPEDRDRVIAAARAAIDGGGDYRDEFRILRADDGVERWVATRGRALGGGPRPRLVGVAYDVTERRAEQQRQTLLAREVDHRAKNILAVVRSIVKLTRADDPRSFAEAVEGRVAALARAHTLLARDRWSGAELSQVVREELGAYSGSGRVVVDGPALRLKPDAVQPLSIVLHELATNAAKYGALSAPGGRVEVRWRVLPPSAAALSDPSRLCLDWTEHDGPPVLAPPTRRGFGSTVVEATVRGQLGGRSSFVWEHEGMRCELSMPADRVLAPAAAHASDSTTPQTRSGAPGDPAAVSLRGRRVLLVEDEPLVALEAAASLVDLGCEVVGPAGTVEEALRLAAAEVGRLDAAVLDINLQGRASFPVGDLLAGAGVPVVHVTGYGSLPEGRAATGLVLAKPLRDGELAAALRRALLAGEAAAQLAAAPGLVKVAPILRSCGE